MDDLKHAIELASESQVPIPRQLVRRCIQRADSLEIAALLYELTRAAWNRIQPRLENAETSALIQRYFLRCIRENPEGGVALTRYEAARELETWFDHLAGIEDA